MYNKGKSILAYLAYPYSSDPEGNTKKGCAIASRIMAKHPNIFVILPHTAVDITLFGDFTERKGEHCTHDHELAAGLEYIIFDKIDMFIIGTDYGDMSPGMIWEHSYVMKLNRERKRQIMILHAKELERVSLGNGRSQIR